MKIKSCPICNGTKLNSTNYTLNPNQNFWNFDCFKGKTLSTCEKCNFTFTAEVFEKESLSKFYNSLYTGSTVSSFKRTENYEFTPRFFSHLKFLETNIDLIDGMNVLEIGPNEVGMIPTFKLFCNPNYYYFDQLEFPIINYFGGKRLGKYFSKKIIAELDSKIQMDLIVSSHSFEHFEPQNLNQDVETIKNILKPNGYISIEVPLELIGEMHPPHTQFFNVKNMSFLFEKHGFEIVSTQSINSFAKIENDREILTSLKSSRKLINIIKSLLSILIPRKIRIRLLKPIYNKNLKALYDGKPYMRILAQKKSNN